MSLPFYRWCVFEGSNDQGRLRAHTYVSLRIVIPVLHQTAGVIQARNTFRKGCCSIGFHRRVEVCGDVPSLHDARGVCRTYSTL